MKLAKTLNSLLWLLNILLGAGIVDHLHIHVVPRWDADTNFMSVVGSVRVVPDQIGEWVVNNPLKGPVVAYCT